MLFSVLCEVVLETFSIYFLDIIAGLTFIHVNKKIQKMKRELLVKYLDVSPQNHDFSYKC